MMTRARTLRRLAVAAVVAATVGLVAAPAEAASSDQDIADQSVIASGDVPATWTASPRDTSGDAQGLKVAAKIPTCKGYVAFEKANNATTSAESQDFSSASDQVHSSSYVYPTDAAAKKTMQALGSPKTVAKCLTAMLQKAVDLQVKGDKSVKSTKAIMKPVAAGASTPDVEAAGFSGGYQISAKDGSAEGRILILIAARVGRVVNTYNAIADPSSDEISTVFQNAVQATLTRTQAAQ